MEQEAQKRGLRLPSPIDTEREPVMEYQGERYSLHLAQRVGWSLPCPVVIISAGWQSGKTEPSPYLLLREIRRKGPGDYGAVGPTYPLLNKKLVPALDWTFAHHLGLGKLNRGSMVFEFSEYGSRRVFGPGGHPPTRVFMGYGADPASLEAGTWRAVLCDESGHTAFKAESFEVLDSRLARYRGRQFHLSRPYGPGRYVEMCREAGYRWSWQVPEEGAEPVVYEEGDPSKSRVGLVCYSSLLNPAFPPEEYWRTKAEMQPYKHSAKYDGIYVKPAGAIYDCFDRRACTFDPAKVEIPDWWPRHLGLDFGEVNTAGVFIREDPKDGTLYVTDYYKAGGEFAEQHVPRLLNKGFPADQDEKRFDRCVGGSWSEGEWRSDYAMAGLPVEQPPIKEVEVGIQRVYRQFKLGRLKVSTALEPLVRQIEDYSRELDDEGEPTEKIADKAKQHGCDGLRYIVAALRPSADWEPVQGSRFHAHGEREGDKRDGREPQEADMARYELNKRILDEEEEEEGRSRAGAMRSFRD